MAVIEKGIPLPLVRQSHKWPIDDMQIGDSIFVSPERGQALRQAVDNYRRTTGRVREFTVRKVEGGYRAWRLA